MSPQKDGKTPDAKGSGGTTPGKNKDAGLNDEHRKILSQDAETALLAAFARCREPGDIRAFLADLCTPQEIRALAERWVIARLLDQGGLSYRDISAATGASTTTIGRVARFLQQEPHHGYRHVLEEIKAERDDEKGFTK